MTQTKSSSQWLEPVVSFVSGVVFAVGLAISGMTKPQKVRAFLDVAGDFDPSLAFVMVGAIAVYSVAFRLTRRRDAPLAGGMFHLPTRRDIDPALVIGAAIFGVGWGLAGYCPGPALTSLGTATVTPFVFVGTMAVGMRLFDALQKLRARGPRGSVAAPKGVSNEPQHPSLR